MPLARWFRRRRETRRFDSSLDETFSVATRLRGTVVVATVEGRIDGKSVDRLERAVATALQGDARSIVLDLRRVSIVLSAGLKLFLKFGRMASGRDGRLAFAVGSADGRIGQILAISAFDRIFPVCETPEDAIAASASRST